MKFSIILLINFLFLFVPPRKDVPASIYDFKLPALKGHDIDLSACKGKKILIVNVPCIASDSRQYAELDALYKKYKDKLIVIGCIADDFAVGPGSQPQPFAYREKDYNVSFPLTKKLQIKGPDMAPVYQWLTEKKHNKLRDSYIKWDFQKYLIDENGNLAAIFDPKVRTNNPMLIAAIEK